MKLNIALTLKYPNPREKEGHCEWKNVHVPLIEHQFLSFPHPWGTYPATKNDFDCSHFVQVCMKILCTLLLPHSQFLPGSVQCISGVACKTFQVLLGWCLPWGPHIWYSCHIQVSCGCWDHLRSVNWDLLIFHDIFMICSWYVYENSATLWLSLQCRVDISWYFCIFLHISGWYNSVQLCVLLAGHCSQPFQPGWIADIYG